MDVIVSNLPSTSLAQSLHPQWRSRLRLCLAAKENSTLSMALHDELLQSHLPLDINSGSVHGAKCEDFATVGGDKVSFPHYDASYQDMLDALEAHAQSAAFTDAIGDLRRNVAIKHHAECFYDLEPHMQWDVVLCVDTNVFDEIVEYVMQQPRGNRSVVLYVMCIPTTDPKVFVDIFEELFQSLEGAEGGSGGGSSRGWQDTLDEGIAASCERTGLRILHFCWVFR